MVVLE